MGHTTVHTSVKVTNPKHFGSLSPISKYSHGTIQHPQHTSKTSQGYYSKTVNPKLPKNPFMTLPPISKYSSLSPTSPLTKQPLRDPRDGETEEEAEQLPFNQDQLFGMDH